ncbi:hypothetical protein AN643_02110 [Candidatus Epulonipiscioides saccharophilum]|nr:hypothetical protein AN643_02110 [Epulopiscium sp. SCG-B10WGA-EpuloB]
MKKKFSILIIGSMLFPQITFPCIADDTSIDPNMDKDMSSKLYEWIKVDGMENGRIKFDSLTGTIVDVETSMISAQIPTEINGSPVIAIGSLAFAGCYALREVIIPEEISYIGDLAFANCSSLNIIYFLGNKYQWEIVTSTAGISKSTVVECEAELLTAL